MEFNSDGSLKLPPKMQKSLDNQNERMNSSRCIKIKKEIINFEAPKKCNLQITLSNAISDFRFVNNIYNYFLEGSTVSTKLIQIDDLNYTIEIGTDFKRCSDCTNLINRYLKTNEISIIKQKVFL